MSGSRRTVEHPVHPRPLWGRTRPRPSKRGGHREVLLDGVRTPWDIGRRPDAVDHRELTSRHRELTSNHRELASRHQQQPFNEQLAPDSAYGMGSPWAEGKTLAIRVVAETLNLEVVNRSYKRRGGSKFISETLSEKHLISKMNVQNTRFVYFFCRAGPAANRDASTRRGPSFKAAAAAAAVKQQQQAAAASSSSTDSPWSKFPDNFTHAPL